MIVHILITSSIFDSKAQTLVNPVNCVGVMGKGLAAEFRIRFPEMFIPECGVTSLALPALGCGNGGLLWSDIRDLIHAALGNLPFDVEVYLPR